MSFSFRTLWNNLFPSSVFDEQSPSLPPELPNLAPELPPQLPPQEGEQHSCFILGVARSLATEGSKVWGTTDEDKQSSYGWCPYPLVDVTHVHLGVRVIAFGLDRCGGGLLPRCSYISGVFIYDGDCEVKMKHKGFSAQFIAEVLEANPMGRLWKIKEDKRVEQERKDRAMAHFTALGCPQDSAPNP